MISFLPWEFILNFFKGSHKPLLFGLLCVCVCVCVCVSGGKGVTEKVNVTLARPWCLYVNLARLRCLDIWLKTILDAFIKVLLGGSESKDSACNSGDQGLIPGSGRSPGEGNDYLLQYSCLKNSMHIGAW